MQREGFEWFDYHDPADNKAVEFDSAVIKKEAHGCAVCVSRPRSFGKKCKKAMRPIEGKPYCRKFDLEASHK